MAASPNYWVTLEEALHSPRSVAEQIVGHLYRTISSINENKSIVGAEYWVQVGVEKGLVRREGPSMVGA